MNELADAPRVKTILERASKLLEFKSKAPELIARKVSAYEDPYEEMVIYPTQKSKFFSRESDVILLCLTHKFKYGNWGKIKKALRTETKCRFDHLLLSRTEKELQRRVDILVKGLEKELKDETKKKKKHDKPSDTQKQMEEDIRDGLIDPDEDMDNVDSDSAEEDIGAGAVEESKEEKIDTKTKKKKRDQKEEVIKKELQGHKKTKA